MNNNLLALIQGADVEWKTLGEVAEIQRGKRVTKNQLVENGKYPVVSGGTGYMGYFDDYNRDKNTITIAQYGTAGYVKWQTEKFWANDVCYSVFPKQDVNKKYLYYCLMNEQEVLYSIKTNAIPAHLPQIDLSNLKIPIPSLEIQQKVVEILDKMTDYVTELTAELTLRQKQYAYYRDKLLTFPESNSLSDSDESLNVRWTTLGEISSIKSGRNKEKAISGKYEVYGSTGVIARTEEYLFDKNLILVARVGANAGYVHVATGKYDVSDNTLIIDEDEKSINQKFLFHLLTKMNLNQYAKGGGQPLVTATTLKELKIPLPSLKLQSKIVEILDKFQALTEDVSGLLPEEIELRQKQYEYWREQLLSFNKK